jgi:hypothetical protein
MLGSSVIFLTPFILTIQKNQMESKMEFFKKTISTIYSHLYRTLHKNQTENAKESETKPITDIEKKDKIIFQSNSKQIEREVECKKDEIIDVSILIKTTEDTSSIPSQDCILIKCDKKSLEHLDSLCKYFEIPQNEAFSRGVWFLSLVRDIEMRNKKIGVIATDQNGIRIYEG